ncbi:unnamed protein product [Boreogadus saida]
MYCIIEGLSYRPTVLRIVATDLSREPEPYLPAPTRSAHASNYFLDPSQNMLPATLSACGPSSSYAPIHTNLPLVPHTALSCHAVLTESQSTPNKPLSQKLKREKTIVERRGRSDSVQCFDQGVSLTRT